MKETQPGSNKQTPRGPGQLGSFSKRVAREPKEFSVDSIRELLRANGFTGTDSLRDLKSWSDSQIEKLAEDLFDFIEERTPPRPSTKTESLLNATASASIRGDTGCSELGCRANKLNVLGAYAGLYADSVFLPVPLDPPETRPLPEHRREQVSRTLFTLLHLDPLIAEGILQPVAPTLHYCKNCAQRALADDDAAYGVALQQAAQHKDEFEFVYFDVADTDLAGIKISGPDAYLEHGRLIAIFQQRPSWAPKRRVYGKGHVLSSSTVSRAGLVQQLFMEFASDAFFHQHYARRHHAAYLTDLPGEAEFFNLISAGDTVASKTATLCAYLSHELPVFADLPLSEILNIRREIPESFDAYRSRLTSVARRYAVTAQTITPKDARDIYADEIRPAVSQLAVAAENERKRRIKKSLLFGGVAVGVITLGATGALALPQVVASLGGAVGVKLLDSMSGSQDTSDVANDSFYFLLRLEQARKSSKAG